jgi:hypothetical protein
MDQFAFEQVGQSAGAIARLVSLRAIDSAQPDADFALQINIEGISVGDRNDLSVQVVLDTLRRAAEGIR